MDDDRRSTERRPRHPVDLSVVVPVHDEAANLQPLFERLGATLGELGLTFEVVFIDDGSLRRLARDPPPPAKPRPAGRRGHAEPELRPPSRP